jgi:hypothetical protein
MLQPWDCVDGLESGTRVEDREPSYYYSGPLLSVPGSRNRNVTRHESQPDKFIHLLHICNVFNRIYRLYLCGDTVHICIVTFPWLRRGS